MLYEIILFTMVNYAFNIFEGAIWNILKCTNSDIPCFWRTLEQTSGQPQRTTGVNLPEPPLTTLSCSFEVLHHGVVMDPTQDLLLHQAKLLSRGQLPLTRVARKTCQVVCVSPRAAHPVAGVYLPPTAGTLSTKPTVRERKENGGRGGEAGERNGMRNQWFVDGVKATFR